MLELIDIKKRYGSKEVLHGISIKFENGIYGLIGPNGSGKSTIMNIMSDVLDMSSGKILYNGTDIKELDDRYCRLPSKTAICAMFGGQCVT